MVTTTYPRGPLESNDEGLCDALISAKPGSRPLSGLLGDRDRLDVVVALRQLAETEKAKCPHPSGGRP